MKLINKNILITGGTSGIGFQLIEQLHHQNNLFIIARNSNKINALKRVYPAINVYQADLANIEEIKNVCDDIRQNVPHLDVLINNAATQSETRFTSDTFEFDSINREITTNLTAICCLSYLLLPHLSHDDEAIILNVNSGLALSPKTNSAVYCATKGALDTFSQSLGYQLSDTNIKVLQAFLPVVNTPMTAGRGNSKITVKQAADNILSGIKKSKINNDIGKVKMLRFLVHFLPFLAKKIMRKY